MFHLQAMTVTTNFVYRHHSKSCSTNFFQLEGADVSHDVNAEHDYNMYKQSETYVQKVYIQPTIVQFTCGMIDSV